MFYHVVRRPLNQTTINTSNQSRNNQRSGSLPPSTLMPRYHYSKIVPNNTTNNSDVSLTRNYFDGHTSKPSMTATTTTTSNNNNPNSYGSFKSTIIPLVANNRITTSNKREFIQIPITREDGTNNQTRSVPITFLSETNPLSPTGSISNNTNGNISPKPVFTNLVRPSSKYFQYHFNNSNEDLTPIPSNVPRLPTVSRRLSLTIPVTTTVTTNIDDDTIKQSIPSPPIRQIPIRLPETTTVASPPVNTSRTSSAVLQSSPISNTLQRQKTDLDDGASSSSTLLTINNSQPSSSLDFPLPSPIRRAEVVAREAIQGITRLQQQRNGLLSENSINRSPTLSRRVIINLKNNQSISLDSRLSSAMKPPPIPSSSRFTQRNNLYHIPVLHEIQMSSHPATESSSSQLSSISNNNHNNGNYKNEFHMAIPVLITTNHDQENQIQPNNGLISRERLPSINHNSNQTLKSILKRSSSRETVSRKNIEDRIESFQLLNTKHNWLTYCSTTNKSSGNLVHPTLNMNKDIQIKNEPIEPKIPEYYYSTIITTGVKRKSTENLSTISAKRLSNESYCSECDILFSKSDNLCQTNSSVDQLNNNKLPFHHPVQIGQFIYVPIPLRSADIGHKPLDLSKKSKKINHPSDKERKILSEKVYPCNFCSIRFCSLKTLHAHQDNYCIKQQRNKTNQSENYHLSLFKCTICSAMFNKEEILLNHMKYVHTNDIFMECLQCRSRFSSKYNLIRHMKILHTNIKSDEKSSTSINLRPKILMKKSSCPFCHIKFSCMETLKEHMRNYCSSRPTIDDMKKKAHSLTYCSSCQISFQHPTSYQAHKMYYCRTH